VTKERQALIYQLKTNKQKKSVAKHGGTHLQSQQLRRLRKKDHEFKASLSYIASSRPA
jgi:hypothetical protein